MSADEYLSRHERHEGGRRGMETAIRVEFPISNGVQVDTRNIQEKSQKNFKKNRAKGISPNHLSPLSSTTPI